MGLVQLLLHLGQGQVRLLPYHLTQPVLPFRCGSPLLAIALRNPLHLPAPQLLFPYFLGISVANREAHRQFAQTSLSTVIGFQQLPPQIV
jgi:hypothetical protein